MEQFSLDKWLENPSRKVVTRDGRPVRIICWDRNTTYWKIIALVTSPDGSVENPYTYDVNGKESDGCLHDHRNNLFFADDELTKFEKEVKDLMNSCCNEIGEADITNELVKEAALNLLDLARKELQPEFDKEMDKMLAETDKVVYQKGQQDALKDLPKWKKATENMEFDKHVLLFEGEERVVLTTEIYKGEYYIEADDLKKLLKEEKTMKKLILCDKDTKENNYNYECPKLNSDDWDELEDSCIGCPHKIYKEVEL